MTPIGANGKPATQVRAHPPPPAETKKDEPQDLSLYFILLAVGGVAFAVFRLRAVRTERRWRVAIQDMARGNDARASEELTHLTKSRLPMFASLAHLALAGLAERRADWDACLSHCEKGLAGIGTNRRLYSDYLLPELIATRALALAATSRAAEAEAQRALLQSQFPAFARAGGAHFRVQLMSAIRASDFDAAAAIARGRTLDLPLPLRDDVLADVVLAASAGATVDEVDRIARELREDEPLRAWIDAVAPGLRNRMHIREAGNATR
ncbi:MAG TPA: hypothetical protein VNO21_24065 [Polyangiaceae bacterium]|nr:hypothetical protein [Polyangiaceae bacterium]